MNTKLLLGGIIAIFVIAAVVMVTSESISLNDILRSLSGMNPRLMSLLVLPLIIVLFFVGKFLHRKNTERKWKNALLQTRAKQQAEAARKATGGKNQ